MADRVEATNRWLPESCVSLPSAPCPPPVGRRGTSRPIDSRQEELLAPNISPTGETLPSFLPSFLLIDYLYLGARCDHSQSKLTLDVLRGRTSCFDSSWPCTGLGAGSFKGMMNCFGTLFGGLLDVGTCTCSHMSHDLRCGRITHAKCVTLELAFGPTWM